MVKKNDERIAFEKIENGYIVTHTWEENSGKQYKYEAKRYYAKTASDTKNKMMELQKAMKI